MPRFLSRLVLSRFALVTGCLLIFAGCAEHRPPLDDDGLPMTDGSEGSGPPGGPTGGDHGGRGGGVWSDVLHTAMQTGMGFLHH